ncbi:hypothetical protein JCM10212_003542 [Sporobolomyces blumeae]
MDEATTMGLLFVELIYEAGTALHGPPGHTEGVGRPSGSGGQPASTPSDPPLYPYGQARIRQGHSLDRVERPKPRGMDPAIVLARTEAPPPPPPVRTTGRRSGSDGSLVGNMGATIVDGVVEVLSWATTGVLCTIYAPWLLFVCVYYYCPLCEHLDTDNGRGNERIEPDQVGASATRPAQGARNIRPPTRSTCRHPRTGTPGSSPDIAKWLNDVPRRKQVTTWIRRKLNGATSFV